MEKRVALARNGLAFGENCGTMSQEPINLEEKL